jgi:hypothetical protein
VAAVVVAVVIVVAVVAFVAVVVKVVVRSCRGTRDAVAWAIVFDLGRSIVAARA